MKGITVDEARDRLPEASDFKPLVVATAVTFISILVVPLLKLIDEVPFQSAASQRVPFSGGLRYLHAVLEALASMVEFAMFAAPLAILLLANYRRLRTRLVAGLLGGGALGGLFNTFDALEWALWNAYDSADIDPSAAYFLSEVSDGFTEGFAWAIIIGGLFVAIPLAITIYAVERWSDITLLRGPTLDETEPAPEVSQRVE